MEQFFPVKSSENSLKWAVFLALLIDVPFLLIILYSPGSIRLTSLFIILLPLSISGLIIYAAYNSRKMNYILGDDEIKISFPLSPLKVSYDTIRNVSKVETGLRLRLFGGGLPGSYWGLFTAKDLGKVQAYTTMHSGEFVLLELDDDAKILVSPLDPDAFLEALREKTRYAIPTYTPLEEDQQDRKRVYSQIVAVFSAWLLLLYYVASVYPNLPDIIPVHFGLDGAPNRYGSKIELYYIVAVGAIFPALNTVFVYKSGKYNKNLSIFLSVVFLLAIGLMFMVVNQMINAI